MATHAPRTEIRVDPGAPLRLPVLDGLRGLAVLLVLFAHASARGLTLFPGFDLRGCGRPGVFLFFVLSSFLLTRQALERDPRELRSARTWGRYAARRVLRIYPAYLAVTLLYLATQGWSGEHFLGHLALRRGERHFWTIPVEFTYYLWLPVVVLALVAVGRRALVRLALLVVAGVVTRVLAAPDYGGLPPEHHVPFAPFVPIFLAGSAAAVLYDAWRTRPEGLRARWARGFDVLTVLCAAALSLHAPAVWSLVAGEEVELTRFHLEFDRFGLLWSGALLGFACGSGGLRRVFETRPARWIGEVSYGAYLFHRVVLLEVEDLAAGWPAPLAFLLFLAGALGAGWLSFVVIERPCLRLVPAGAR